MTFSPEVEARFKRIEDAQVVTAELQRRFELEGKERIGRLEAIQDAMTRWQDQMADKQQEFETKMNALVDGLIELRRTVDRFLKARTNGGEN